MKAEQVLTLALNTLNRWKLDLDEAGEEDLTISPSITIIEYSLAHLADRTAEPVRNGIALAYAILGTEDN